MLVVVVDTNLITILCLYIFPYKRQKKGLGWGGQNKISILVIFNSIISFLKEEAACPPKCKLLHHSDTMPQSKGSTLKRLTKTIHIFLYHI